MSGGAYPGGARFAFTILDDTDDATVDNVRPVYDLLHELGMRTTKTAWPLDCPEGSALFFAAETLADPEYLAFVRELGRRGFELAWHGATMEPSTRERTLRGLEAFERLLGVRPTLAANHAQNLENVYWGAHRYRTAPLRLALSAAERLFGRPRYTGHDPDSPYFWGDVCRERFRFVRSFAFASLDGALPPGRPYRLRSTPWVNYWFCTADAPDARHFAALVTRAAVDRLRDSGGAVIVSTHLGKRFTRGGRVDPQVEDALRYIAAQPGWFVPASELLEHQLAAHAAAAERPLPFWARWRLELGHLADRVRAHTVVSRTASA